jgi:hypothetical protein
MVKLSLAAYKLLVKNISSGSTSVASPEKAAGEADSGDCLLEVGAATPVSRG